MIIDELRGHIAAVVDYNWESEIRDAKENGLEGHILNHLLALAEFIGEDTSDFWTDLTGREWTWDKNDDEWDRPCPVCAEGPLDLKGYGAVCPNGHVMEGE